MSAEIEVSALVPSDRQAWMHLAREYKRFYRTEVSPAQLGAAWERVLRGDGVQALGARLEGRLVGIAHFLFHTSTWSDDVCYLQDLFTDPQARGMGAARQLIESVAQIAMERGAARFYWLTAQDNATARKLYERVAEFNGFIRYDYPLPTVTPPFR